MRQRPRDVRHVPVLLEQVLRCLDPQPGQVIADCTLGLGGHAAALLTRVLPDGVLIGIDFDPHNLVLARARLAAVGGTFHLQQGNFAGLQQTLTALGFARVDAVLADLGVASPQIDDPARGFSYKKDGPLDMRMAPTRGKPASEVLATLSQRDLERALLELGDESDAPRIAALIVRRRQQQPITTTRQLMEIVCAARDFTVERALGAKLHPAARTFQALRMLVNRETGNLENLLRVLPDCLKPGGIACIISFHSGEDRRVKASFKQGLEAGIYADGCDDPWTATTEEIVANPRSRSAKLRWVRRANP